MKIWWRGGLLGTLSRWGMRKSLNSLPLAGKTLVINQAVLYITIKKFLNKYIVMEVQYIFICLF